MTEEKNYEKWSKIVVLISKFFLALATITYILGLLITNFYFGKFGVTTLSLLRANYLLVGSFGLIPFIISIYVGNLVLMSKKAMIKYNETKEKNYLVLVFFYLFLSIVMMAFAIVMVNSVANIKMMSSLYCLLYSLVIIAMIWSTFYLKGKIKSIPDFKYKKIHHSIYFHFGLVICLVICILLYSQIFSSHLYPSIPSYLGGVKPVLVDFYLDPNSVVNESFKSCGSDKDENKAWKVELILATDKEYILSVGDDKHILWIKKDEIKAIRYSNPGEKDNSSNNGKKPVVKSGTTS